MMTPPAKDQPIELGTQEALAKVLQALTPLTADDRKRVLYAATAFYRASQ